MYSTKCTMSSSSGFLVRYIDGDFYLVMCICLLVAAMAIFKLPRGFGNFTQSCLSLYSLNLCQQSSAMVR